MPVIAMVGNKGGAGKTTLSVNLASGLLRRATVAMLDADPQGSSLQWNSIGENESTPPVYQANDKLVEQLLELKSRYHYVVADCPPSVHAPQTHAVLEVADIALVPVQPSPVDLWATIHIENAIAAARVKNPSLNAILVINQLEPRTTLSKLIRDALEEIEVTAAKTSIRRRAVYRACALEGRSIYAMGKRGQEAVAELEQLIDEVIPA